MHLLYGNINDYKWLDYENFSNLLPLLDKIKLQKLVKIEDQKLFLLSRYLLHQLFIEFYHKSYLDVKIYYNEFHKPLMCDGYFNISHSNFYSVVVISDKKIGVDIEKIRPVDKNIISYFCTENEKKYIFSSNDIQRSFWNIFCLKEAYVKMLGSTLLDFQTIEFQISPWQIKCANQLNLVISILDEVDGYVIAVIEENN